MNTNESGSSEEALRKLLKEWRSETSLPPRFQESVWRRLERTPAPASSPGLMAVAHWLGAVSLRPAFAISYMIVLLVGGATFGWAEARHETTHIKDDLSQRYVRVLDPFDPYQSPRQ